MISTYGNIVPAARVGSSLAGLCFWGRHNRKEARLGAAIAVSILYCVTVPGFSPATRSVRHLCRIHVGPSVFPWAAVLRWVDSPGQGWAGPYFFSWFYFMTPWPKPLLLSRAPGIPDHLENLLKTLDIWSPQRSDFQQIWRSQSVFMKIASDGVLWSPVVTSVYLWLDSSATWQRCDGLTGTVTS